MIPQAFPGLYMDEDSGDEARVAAASHGGFGVATAEASGMRRKTDEEQLAFASSLGRVLCTHNSGDFQAIHSKLMRDGEHHAGIIVVFQQDSYSPGEFVRRLLLLAQAHRNPADQLLFLSNFS